MAAGRAVKTQTAATTAAGNSRVERERIHMRESGWPNLRPLSLIAGLVLGLLTYFGYTHRLQVAARIWHWRHGDSISFNGYDIPVPSGWLVEGLNGQTLHMLDTANLRHLGHAGIGAFLTVAIGKRPRSDLAAWVSSEEQIYRRDGVPLSVQPPLRLGGTTIACVRAKAARFKPGQAAFTSLECLSEGGLTLGFIGSQASVTRFYAIVAGIRRSGPAPRGAN